VLHKINWLASCGPRARVWDPSYRQREFKTFLTQNTASIMYRRPLNAV